MALAGLAFFDKALEEFLLERLRPRLSEAGRGVLNDLPSLRSIAQIPVNLRGVHERNRLRYKLPRL